MKKTISCLLLSLMIALATTRTVSAGEFDSLAPKDNEIAIHFSCVEVPLDRLLLVRKDTQYCAVKFIKTWDEIDEEELKKHARGVASGGHLAEIARESSMKKYANYEVYYQGDGSGDFSGNAVTKSEGKASALPLRGPFRPFIYQPGDSYIKCGPFKLTWAYKKNVCFMPPDKGHGDFGFEIAPTPWTDITQVNVFDPRVKWYRHDEKRERLYIPIDKLWPTE